MTIGNEKSTVQVDIVHLRSGKKMCTLERVGNLTSIAGIKDMIQSKFPKYYASRQSYRLNKTSKSLADKCTLSDLNISNECTLYFKDLGPQVGWDTVFYTEYAGPLFIYLMFYWRPSFIYGEEYEYKPSDLQVVQLACICHTFHYAKRLFETRFVHRFSHGTMPIMNLFKNSTYYWGFAAWMAYFINHPLYTAPMYGDRQIYAGLFGFIFCELGNLSIHLLFMGMRPKGTTKRQIPQPSANPYTWLFSLVSCPNYTYEVGAWISFTVMTQTLVGGLFAFVGFLQMSQWAIGKHRNYKKEFSSYPRGRKAIVPFMI